MHYQAIVVGLGSMGAATTYYLAQQGIKVLGLEQYAIVHENGSHAGQSRIIRKAYAEHPDYVPLLHKAYENWAKFEQATEQQFFNDTGLVYFGLPDAPFIQGVKTSAKAHHIPVELYDSKEGQSKFPWFHIPDAYQVAWEPEAGYVTPERTIASFTQQAQKAGAILQAQETVQNWQLKGTQQIEVTTNKATYTTERLIITAGAYASQLLPNLGRPLQTTRQLLAWVQLDKPIDLSKLPCWIFEVPEVDGIYYGFPAIQPPWLFDPSTPVKGFKVAHHTRGQAIITNQHSLLPDEAYIAQEKENLQNFLQTYFPTLNGAFVEVKQCLYTYSPDEHFIIDYLPNTDRRVVVATGFSGHGFKFVPAIGEVLANLALGNTETDELIDFLRLKRFQ
ncbi:MAG TPA: N-methyl-L-tryptophan oxidase [Microscillaceae bacterium]|nr:N-methyl-L-tryptophan oxidase [Microscillaceae bacterium]